MPVSPSQAFQPTTFPERGVYVPFTTPALAGARARASGRGPFELVVPNPSGGRGVYVMPWKDMRDLCRPSLHDVRLSERMARLREVTPGTIRQAARDVAAEGLAGRPARAAAAAARDRDGAQRLGTNFHLLLLLVQQSEAPGSNPVPPDRERPDALERRARQVIAHLSPRLGMGAERIAASLEELAAVFEGVGIGPGAARARLPRALANVAALKAEMDRRVAEHGDDATAGFVRAAADLTAACASALLRDARRLTDGVVDLVLAWCTGPEHVADAAARPEWLLDGWDPICHIWRGAETADARRAALDELALLVPVIPREVGAWLGGELDAEAPQRLRSKAEPDEDWRTGAGTLDLVARNEHLRALCA